MSKLGDVVFCVDCARGADAQRNAGSDENGQSAPPPRRMAVKKDANGDPLCTPCLDSRRATRNAAFMRNDDRSPSASRGSIALDGAMARGQAAPPVVRVASAIRITRTVVTPTAPSPVPAEARAASTRARRVERKPGPGRSRTTRAHRAPSARKATREAPEREFARLAAEIGFARARQLLESLKHKLRALR